MSSSSEDKDSPQDSKSRPAAAAELGACQSKPRDKKPAIQLLKEDLGVLKQDLFNIFKEKDGKKDEKKDKTPLNVSLKEDLDQFKNELSSFTEDISMILRKGLRKEENAKIKTLEPNEENTQKEDSSKVRAQDEKEGESEETFKIKAQEQKKEQNENAEKDGSFKIKARDDDADGKNKTVFKIKAQDVKEDGENKTTFRIKAQEQTGQSGDTEKEDPFKLKATQEAAQTGNTEKAKSLKIHVQSAKEDQISKKTFNIKDTLQSEPQSENPEKGDSFTIKADEQETEKKHPFIIKLQNITRGKFKEDFFKIKAKGQEGPREAELKDNKSRSERKEDSFKLKAQDHVDNAENVDNSEDGWELLERHELEQNAERFDRKTKNVDPEKTETEPEPDAEASVLNLSSQVGLLQLRGLSDDQPCCRLQDDAWIVKNFAQYLTLDPHTANAELLLSHGNRTAQRMWSCDYVAGPPADHVTDERFEQCPQVLCREGLLDSVYWEVQWAGGADVGVTYHSISRRGRVVDGLLGHSRGSWSLECNEEGYTPCHQQRRYRSVVPEPFSRRVGVFLDFKAGALSFYSVSASSMQLLHTFRASFTEPLYPAFWLWAWGGSVSLRQVELGWERLLH